MKRKGRGRQTKKVRLDLPHFFDVFSFLIPTATSSNTASRRFCSSSHSSFVSHAMVCRSCCMPRCYSVPRSRAKRRSDEEEEKKKQTRMRMFCRRRLAREGLVDQIKKRGEKITWTNKTKQDETKQNKTKQNKTNKNRLPPKSAGKKTRMVTTNPSQRAKSA